MTNTLAGEPVRCSSKGFCLWVYPRGCGGASLRKTNFPVIVNRPEFVGDHLLK